MAVIRLRALSVPPAAVDLEVVADEIRRHAGAAGFEPAGARARLGYPAAERRQHGGGRRAGAVASQLELAEEAGGP